MHRHTPHMKDIPFIHIDYRRWDTGLLTWRGTKDIASVKQGGLVPQNTKPRTLNLHWFLFHLPRLCFQRNIKELFLCVQINMRDGWFGPTSPVPQWFGIKWHGFRPPHGPARGDLCVVLWFLYRICASVQWERCNELMLETRRLLWVFFFSFQALLLTLFSFFLLFPGILSLVELLCIPGRNNVGHIAGLVWSNRRGGVLLFLWWLAELCAPSHFEWIMLTRWWIIKLHLDRILDYTDAYSTIYAKKHISLYFYIKIWYYFLLANHMSQEVTSSCTNFYQIAYGIQVSISLQCTMKVSRT